MKPRRKGDVSNSLLQLILSQSQTFPNVSTASGFTFQIGSGDNVELESRLYGPLFGERALTNGNGQLSITFNLQQLRFQTLNGSQIRNSNGPAVAAQSRASDDPAIIPSLHL